MTALLSSSIHNNLNVACKQINSGNHLSCTCLEMCDKLITEEHCDNFALYLKRIMILIQRIIILVLDDTGYMHEYLTHVLFQLGKYMTLDQIVTDEDYTDCHRLHTACEKCDLEHVADVKGWC